MNKSEAKKIENQNIREAIKRLPRLFEMTTFVDDKSFLENYGIFIPEKEKMPLGYLKLWPQDFIVEEIAADKKVTNIFPEKFISKEKSFFYEDPIIWATLVKCNFSSIEVIEEIAKYLEIEPENIKIAGIKDKHAITSQLISIRKGDIEKLYKLSEKYFFLKNIFSSKKENYIGNLQGNRFTVLIRTREPLSENDFSKKIELVKKSGFYNFYYLQRFGVPRLINAECGLAILKGEYEKALKIAFCDSKEREIPYFKNIRKEIEKIWGDWEEIEKITDFFPDTFKNERKMVNYLTKKPKDFIGALQQIPQLVQIWLISFSSLLFNKKISFFIKENKKIPLSLPLSLIPKTNRSFYKEDLKSFDLYSHNLILKNIKPFKGISGRGGATRETIAKVKILNYKIIPQGIILNFDLPSGSYATTFLSHLFTLVSGSLPKNFSNLPIDTKANLKQRSLEEVLNKFSDVVSTPSWRILWRIY